MLHWLKKSLVFRCLVLLLWQSFEDFSIVTPHTIWGQSCWVVAPCSLLAVYQYLQEHECLFSSSEMLIRCQRVTSCNRRLVSFSHNKEIVVLELKCVAMCKVPKQLVSSSCYREYLGSVSSPVMFCHNDMQEGNILLYCGTMTDKEALQNPQLVLIDFEYCSYNYRGFDLANHFLEWTYDYTNSAYPYFTVNKNNYPTREQQVGTVRV